jgi:predicted dienelactone hydrolase
MRILCLILALFVSACALVTSGVPAQVTVQLAGRDVAIWWPTSGVGLAPLIVFSHGFNGCNTQSTFLLESLADEGYLVVAPNHADANCGTNDAGSENFGDPATWTDQSYRNRLQDLDAVMGALKLQPGTYPIRWDQVALVGHSLGGYTVLGAAGGWPSWKMREPKAVLALSPYCQPYVLNGALDQIDVPVMYQGGTRDLGITPTVKAVGGCYDKTPSVAYFVELRGAGHFAWTDLQADAQVLIKDYSIKFLDKHVRERVTVIRRESGVSDFRSK